MNLSGIHNLDAKQVDENPLLMPTATGAGKLQSDDASFKDLLGKLVEKVDSLQKDADASIKDLVTGQGNVSVHNVAVKMEEASIAFDLMMEIRNKLLEAYQEISRMQV